MKICSIIAEFNPLHNGHVKLINFAKKHADAVCIVMSGNFTERAMPAISDKYSRAVDAVVAGADLVVELPTIFATSSAENFAHGGVAVAKKLGSDFLCFGSESGNLQRLQECANTQMNDNTNVKKALAEGLSYPAAVAAAFPQYKDLLSSPNDTLALEYLRALKNLDCDARPLVMKRLGKHDAKEADVENPSSTFVRSLVDRGDDVALFAPSNAANFNVNVEKDYKTFAATATSLMSKDYLQNIQGVCEGLENKIAGADATCDFDLLISQIKSKRYTQMKLQRLILSALLGISKDDVARAKSLPPTVKPLAVNSQKLALLSLTDHEPADEITRRADAVYTALSGKKMQKSFVKVDV